MCTGRCINYLDDQIPSSPDHLYFMFNICDFCMWFEVFCGYHLATVHFLNAFVKHTFINLFLSTFYFFQVLWINLVHNYSKKIKSGFSISARQCRKCRKFSTKYHSRKFSYTVYCILQEFFYQLSGLELYFQVDK